MRFQGIINIATLALIPVCGLVFAVPNQPELMQHIEPEFGATSLVQTYAVKLPNIHGDTIILALNGAPVIEQGTSYIDQRVEEPLDLARFTLYSYEARTEQACLEFYKNQAAFNMDRRETLLSGLCWKFRVRTNLFGMSDNDLRQHVGYLIYLKRYLDTMECLTANLCPGRELVYPPPVTGFLPENLTTDEEERIDGGVATIRTTLKTREEELAKVVRLWSGAIGLTLLVLTFLRISHGCRRNSFAKGLHLFFTGQLPQEVAKEEEVGGREENEQGRKNALLRKMAEYGASREFLAELSEKSLREIEEELRKATEKRALLARSEAYGPEIKARVEATLLTGTLEEAEAHLTNEDRKRQLLTRAGPHADAIRSLLMKDDIEGAEVALGAHERRAGRMRELASLGETASTLPPMDKTKVNGLIDAAERAIDAKPRDFNRATHAVREAIKEAQSMNRSRHSRS